MTNLATRYLGLPLAHPIIASASACPPYVVSAMNRAVRRSLPFMSPRNTEWSHTPASTAGLSICSIRPATPPT